MDGALSIGAGITVGQEQQGGSQALASSAEKIAGDFADRLESSRALAGKLLFNQDQVIADEVEDFLDGQERDGRSSTRRYWAKRYARKSGSTREPSLERPVKRPGAGRYRRTA